VPAPPLSGAALGPATPENSPGALNLRGRVNAGGDGVHSPLRAVDIVLRAPTRRPHSLWGGGAKTVPSSVCPQEHPPVCSRAIGADSGQPLAAKPFGQLEEQLPGVSPFAGSRWFPRGHAADSGHNRHCLSRSKFSCLMLTRTVSVSLTAGWGACRQLRLSPPLVKAPRPYVLWIFSGCVPLMLVSRSKRDVWWRDCDGQR
jgi:hypothetical protein